MMRHLIVIGLLVATPQLAAAQFPADVQPGTRVRVWIPEAARQEQWPERRQLLRGTVESLDGSVLRLTVPSTTGSIGIPRTSVRRLDVSHSQVQGVREARRRHRPQPLEPRTQDLHPRGFRGPDLLIR